MVKCLNIGENIGKPIYRSISTTNHCEETAENPSTPQRRSHLLPFWFCSVQTSWCSLCCSSWGRGCRRETRATGRCRESMAGRTAESMLGDPAGLCASWDCSPEGTWASVMNTNISSEDIIWSTKNRSLFDLNQWEVNPLLYEHQKRPQKQHAQTILLYIFMFNLNDLSCHVEHGVSLWAQVNI